MQDVVTDDKRLHTVDVVIDYDTDGAAETYDVPQKNRKGMAAHLAADYLSDRDTRPLLEIVSFCSPRTRGGREVDILRLGSPCGSDEDQSGPNHY